MSVEITAKQADKLPHRVADAPQVEVFVALIDPADLEGQIAAVGAIHAHGLRPVPHVPARFVRDLDDLKRRLEGLCQAGQGGANPGAGRRRQASARQLPGGDRVARDRAPAGQRHHGFGMAGHPEGNADITATLGEGALIEALKLKQAYAKDHGSRPSSRRSSCSPPSRLQPGPRR